MKKLNKKFIEIIRHIKHLTDIDISEICHVSNKPRTFMQVDISDLSKNDQASIERISYQYKKFGIALGGYKAWSISAI